MGGTDRCKKRGGVYPPPATTTARSIVRKKLTLDFYLLPCLPVAGVRARVSDPDETTRPIDRSRNLHLPLRTNERKKKSTPVYPPNKNTTVDPFLKISYFRCEHPPRYDRYEKERKRKRFKEESVSKSVSPEKKRVKICSLSRLISFSWETRRAFHVSQARTTLWLFHPTCDGKERGRKEGPRNDGPRR